MSAVRSAFIDLFAGPFREMLHGLEAVLGKGVRALLLVGAGLVAGWWIYVPAHELLHAFGCWAAGGEVSRLEIDPMYGARALARIFPFVAPGGAYAGRLSGFDTRGSDWIYLATDLAPFVLALFPGFWWLRRAARAARPLAFGASLPAAVAPLLSLSGDAYEIGSLVVVHLPPWRGRRLLVGDDLGAKAAEVAGLGDTVLLSGLAAAAAVGLLWALGWMWLARRLASRLGAPELAPQASAAVQPAGSG